MKRGRAIIRFVCSGVSFDPSRATFFNPQSSFLSSRVHHGFISLSTFNLRYSNKLTVDFIDDDGTEVCFEYFFFRNQIVRSRNVDSLKEEYIEGRENLQRWENSHWKCVYARKRKMNLQEYCALFWWQRNKKISWNFEYKKSLHFFFSKINIKRKLR